MDKERLKCITSSLYRYQLTIREKLFIESVERYFNEKGVLTEQQQSILEGIFREKTGWLREAIHSLSGKSKPKNSVKDVC